VTAATAEAPHQRPSELRARRLLVGLSQVQLARVLCVNHTTVSRWESGARRPAHELVPAVARALGVSSDQIEEWFGHVPTLGGDTIGRLPGLKRLLRDRGIDLRTAADRCGVPAADLAGCVFGRRSLPRFLVPRLAGLLDLAEADFLHAARSSIVARRGSFLRELRRERGLTQAALGLRIGRSEAAICTWELHRAIPSPASIRRLARALDVHDDDLCQHMSWPSPPRLMISSDTLPAHELVRWRRLQEGLNRAQLARCVGVTAQTVRRWEHGDFRSRPLTRARLVTALHLPQLDVPRS